MCGRRMFVAGGAALLLCLTACASVRPIQTKPAVLRSGAHRVKMDLVYLGERALWPVVELRLSGKTGRFILDSGAAGIAVCREFALANHLPDRGRARVGLRSGSIVAELVGIPDLDFGGALLPAQDALVLETLDEANEMFGCRVDGIVGTDLFDHAIVRWNYEAGWAELRAATNPVQKTGLKYLSIHKGRGLCWVMADLEGGGNSDLFVLDTGYAGSVIAARAHANAKSLSNVHEFLSVAGRTKSIRIGRLSAVAVAGERFTDVALTLEDSAAPGGAALLGSGLFRHSELIVDFARGRFGVRKSVDSKDNIGGWGVSVRRKHGALRVVDLAVGGPAANSGVVVGDLVETVAGQPAPESVSAFYRLLSERSEVVLGLLRAGETRQVSVTRGAYLPLVKFR